jgi:transposase
MSRYVVYNPDQDALLPASLREELGEQHLAVFVHLLVERLDLSEFEAEHCEAGRPSYPPQLLLKVWLYAYALGLTSARRLEQRLSEDLGFRYLAGGWKPDHWTLSTFRRSHPKRLNDVFTQVLETARGMGMGQLGRVAVDSTRVEANASPDKSQSQESLRRERAKLRQRVRRWQQQCNRQDQEASGGSVGAPADWQQRLAEIPRQLEQLRKSGQKRSSRVDPESRYLRKRGGFCLGYTAEVAVSDDHVIVAQRVHQAAHDSASLASMTELVERECGTRPAVVLADAGYYSKTMLNRVEQSGITVYVPDRLSAIELAGGPRVEMNARQRRRHPGLEERRERLRDPAVRACYARRKTMVEPVIGVLKQQRGMRKFRCRGLTVVSGEWALATTAFNLTHMFAKR